MISYGNSGGYTVQMEGPFGSVGTSIRMCEVALPLANWKGAESPFSQQVPLEGISIRSKVDLLPSAEQLESFRSQELALTTENRDGVLTVFAIGDKPRQDLSMQAVMTEVVL